LKVFIFKMVAEVRFWYQAEDSNQQQSAHRQRLNREISASVHSSYITSGILPQALTEASRESSESSSLRAITRFGLSCQVARLWSPLASC
jgi:hypothetical protein